MEAVTHLGLLNAKTLKQFRMLDWQFNNLRLRNTPVKPAQYLHACVHTGPIKSYLLDLADLLLQSTHHLIRAVWHLLNHHQRHLAKPNQ